MKKVAEYTYKDITALHENATIRRVIQTMVRHRVSAIPIVDKFGDYVGCVSEMDVLNAGLPHYMKRMKDTLFMAGINKALQHMTRILDSEVKQLIEKDFPTVQVSETISHAAELMYRNARVVLPVLDGKRLVGLISRIDILSVAFEKSNENEQRPC